MLALLACGVLETSQVLAAGHVGFGLVGVVNVLVAHQNDAGRQKEGVLSVIHVPLLVQGMEIEHLP